MAQDTQITELLAALRAGEEGALERLFQLVTTSRTSSPAASSGGRHRARPPARGAPIAKEVRRHCVVTDR